MTTVLHGALLLIVVDALVITLVVDSAAIVGWLKTRQRACLGTNSATRRLRIGGSRYGSVSVGIGFQKDDLRCCRLDSSDVKVINPRTTHRTRPRRGRAAVIARAIRAFATAVNQPANTLEQKETSDA
jgi:hypothetical protein